jgi:hypothetical protein
MLGRMQKDTPKGSCRTIPLNITPVKLYDMLTGCQVQSIITFLETVSFTICPNTYKNDLTAVHPELVEGQAKHHLERTRSLCNVQPTLRDMSNLC